MVPLVWGASARNKVAYADAHGPLLGETEPFSNVLCTYRCGVPVPRIQKENSWENAKISTRRQPHSALLACLLACCNACTFPAATSDNPCALHHTRSFSLLILFGRIWTFPLIPNKNRGSSAKISGQWKPLQSVMKIQLPTLPAYLWNRLKDSLSYTRHN